MFYRFISSWLLKLVGLHVKGEVGGVRVQGGHHVGRLTYRLTPLSSSI